MPPAATGPGCSPSRKGWRIASGTAAGRCARPAGPGASGLNLLIGNVTSGEDTDDFFTAQLRQLEAYRGAWRGARQARIAVGRVIVPFDSADDWTRARYAEYAASRRERTLAPQGERRTLFAPDLVGTSDQILEALVRDPVLAEVSELRLELPYEFRPFEYEQILGDAVKHILPQLGWKAAGPAVPFRPLQAVSEAWVPQGK